MNRSDHLELTNKILIIICRLTDIHLECINILLAFYLSFSNIENRMKSHLIERRKKFCSCFLYLFFSFFRCRIRWLSIENKTLFPLFTKRTACTFTSRRIDICMLMRASVSYSLHFFLPTFIITAMHLSILKTIKLTAYMQQTYK
jgi:hypothetical protein